jgi:hypothetical protein
MKGGDMIKNLTPHPVKVGEVTIAPSGMVARVSASYAECGTIEGFPVFMQEYGPVVDLPGPEDGVVLVVSAIVAAALKGSRSDVVALATGHPGVVRNEQGQIQSVPGFVITA